MHGVSHIAITPELGAQVQAVDLSQPLRPGAFDAILAVFHRYSVITFRGQQLSPHALARFAALFGELDVHHMTEHTLPDLPQVRILSNAKKAGRTIGITRGGMHWHSDLSYKPAPASATLLYGIECPPEGADTQFVNMATVYDALPQATRARIAGLRVVHDRNFRYSQLYPNRAPLTPEQIAKVPPTEHPLVRVHPVTGRKSIFVAKDVVSHVVGMPAAESRALIDELEAFATEARFVYSHRWQPGDLVVWDDRCTLHRATPYDDRYTRTLHRVQVKGEPPIAA